MDPVLLSRIQFAFTAGFHWIFASASIGTALMTFIFWTMALKTNKEEWKESARLLSKILAVLFLLGVPSGIVMEFQFGANWAEYSKFVGSIFGPPLMLEGLFAFALESTFIGMLVFGMRRLSTRALWFASLMVFIGTTLSAMWILIANSWQQTPSGFVVANGRAELVNFIEAVFNPLFISQYTHTVGSAFVTGAVLSSAIGALILLRKGESEAGKAMVRAGVLVLFVFSVIQLFPTGHEQGVVIAEYQPTKLAADEGLFETQSNAPMHIIGIIDETNRRFIGISIPGLASFLAFGDTEKEVMGLEDAARYVWYEQVKNGSFYSNEKEKEKLINSLLMSHGINPDDPMKDEKMVEVIANSLPVSAMFYVYRLMVGIGTLLIVVGLVGTYYLVRGNLFEKKWFLKALIYSLPLPWIASEAGWFTHEIGRMPWIVWGLVTVNSGVSGSVSAGEVMTTLVAFVVLYLVLFAVWIGAVRKLVIDAIEEVE